MLKVENVSFGYTKNEVLKGISLAIRKPGIYTVIGGNGAGKTTLFELLYGMLRPQAGEISWEVPRREMVYASVDALFYPRITCEEFLMLCAKGDRPAVERWNRLFELPLREVIDNLSTGMKQRLKLLSVLLLDKKVLLLDEPFNNLDIAFIYILRRILIEERAKGRLILLSSHILDAVIEISDEIFLLENGVLSEGIPQPTYESLKSLFEKQAETKLNTL